MEDTAVMTWRTFRLGKAGNAETDYEDASAGDAERERFAIADGASEASFAGLWASLLVEGFVADPGKPWSDLDWVEPVRQAWAREVDELTLPWYAEDKRALGAYATFLGFSPRRQPSSDGLWRAIAVGDACLFQLRGSELKKAFPLTRSADFGNQPELINSRRPSFKEAQQVRGRWQLGDRFLLMTDALAHWFLLGLERNDDPLGQLGDLLAEEAPEATFAGWIEERRRLTLRNDDVTLMIVDLQ